MYNLHILSSATAENFNTEAFIFSVVRFFLVAEYHSLTLEANDGRVTIDARRAEEDEATKLAADLNRPPLIGSTLLYLEHRGLIFRNIDCDVNTSMSLYGRFRPYSFIRPARDQT